MEKNTSDPGKYSETKISDEDFSGFPTKILVPVTHGDPPDGVSSESIFSVLTGICISMYEYCIPKSAEIILIDENDLYKKKLKIVSPADVLLTLPIAVPEVQIDSESNGGHSFIFFGENGLPLERKTALSGEQKIKFKSSEGKIKFIAIVANSGTIFITHLAFP